MSQIQPIPPDKTKPDGDRDLGTESMIDPPKPNPDKEPYDRSL
jgi:hypothetical protein